MARPLVLLDVDGVINPFGPGACPDGFAEHDLFPGEEPIRINPTHGAWLTELLTVVDIAWASGWNDEANRLLTPLLGIPALPVVTMPSKPFDPSAKVPVIAAYVQERPTAWIDDAHTSEARAWAQKRRAPTVLISTDSAVGLTRESIDRVLTWANGLWG